MNVYQVHGYNASGASGVIVCAANNETEAKKIAMRNRDKKINIRYDTVKLIKDLVSTSSSQHKIVRYEVGGDDGS